MTTARPTGGRLGRAPQPPGRHPAHAPAPDSPPRSAGRRTPPPRRAPGPAPPGPSGPCRAVTGATAAAVHVPPATSAPPYGHREGRAHGAVERDARAAAPHPSRTDHGDRHRHRHRHRRDHAHHRPSGQGPPLPPCPHPWLAPAHPHPGRSHPNRNPHRNPRRNPRRHGDRSLASVRSRFRPPYQPLLPYRAQSQHRRSPPPEPASARVSTPVLAPAPVFPTARTARGSSRIRGADEAARSRARVRERTPTLTWIPARRPCEKCSWPRR